MHLFISNNSSRDVLCPIQIAPRSSLIESEEDGVVIIPCSNFGKWRTLPLVCQSDGGAAPGRPLKELHAPSALSINDGDGSQTLSLFHFTSANALPAIACCGLTIGDVPTRLLGNRGKIAVWLTKNSTPKGHGLEEAAVDKKRIRLRVQVPRNLLLFRWNDWKQSNVEPATYQRLEYVAGPDAAPENWYLYFGWLSADAIVDAVDMTNGKSIPNWQQGLEGHSPIEAVPYSQRQRWHRQLLRDVRARMMR